MCSLHQCNTIDSVRGNCAIHHVLHPDCIQVTDLHDGENIAVIRKHTFRILHKMQVNCSILLFRCWLHMYLSMSVVLHSYLSHCLLYCIDVGYTFIPYTIYCSTLMQATQLLLTLSIVLYCIDVGCTVTSNTRVLYCSDVACTVTSHTVCCISLMQGAQIPYTLSIVLQ